MSKKDFIIDLFKELGLPIVLYTRNYIVVNTEKGPVKVYTFTDPKWNKEDGLIRIFKIKPLHENIFTVDDERKVRAFLMQRGFESTVDSYISSGKCCGCGCKCIRIRSKVAPWNQTAKHMTDKEVIEDALTVQKRYHPVEYLGEEEEDETCLD